MAVTSSERALRTVPERTFTSQVVGLARQLGWTVHHSRPAMMRSGKWATALQGHPGLPDVILVRPPRVLFLELKRQHGGVLSPGQQVWLEQLRLCPGVEVYVFKPGDFPEIAKVLQGAT